MIDSRGACNSLRWNALGILLASGVLRESVERLFERLKAEEHANRYFPGVICSSVCRQVKEQRCPIDYIQLGKPNQNTFLERLNHILRNRYLYL